MRFGRLDELIDVIKNERPNLPWMGRRAAVNAIMRLLGIDISRHPDLCYRSLFVRPLGRSRPPILSG